MKTTAERYPYLLDPEHLGGRPAVCWLGNRMLARWLNEAAACLAEQDTEKVQSISVLVNARRPRHPARLADRRSDSGVMVKKIERTLDGIAGQAYPDGALQKTIVMVDEGLHINPAEREAIEGRGHLMRVAHRTNHSRGLNDGIMQARQMEPSILMILDAGTHYATNQAFRAASHILSKEGVRGAFGSHLADSEASVTQSLVRTLGSFLYNDVTGPTEIAIDRVGLIPADGMAYMAPDLPLLPLDETYGRGGGNDKFVRQRVAEEYERFMYHPALSVQSGEQVLGPLAMISVGLERARLQAPTEYSY